jgi:ribosomal protein S18 acetylase RimI-like enzyme
LKIRQAQEKDSKKIAKFWEGIIQDDFGYELNPEWHEDVFNLESVYIKPEKAFLIIAEIDNEIVGTIAARPYHKKYKHFKSKYNPDNTAGIWRHYIKKELRGQQIGTKLLQKLEKLVRQVHFEKIYLHTQKTISGSLEYWLAKQYKVVLDEGDDLQTVHLEKII